MSALLDPSSVVVVGATTDPAKAGHGLLENLASFDGLVHGLGRRTGSVAGRPVITDLADLERAADLAVLAVPAPATLDALEQLARHGTKAAIVCAGGFAESGADGALLQQRVADVADRLGIRVLGPNTSGIAVPSRRLFGSFVPAIRSLEPGPMAVVAQSGGVAHAIAFAGHNIGLGVSVMIGVGNGADLGLAELIELAAAHDDTRVVVVHVEGTEDGRALAEVVRRVRDRVPVVVLKAGRSDVDHLSRSHTGALTGDWAVARAVLSRAGAVVVESLSEVVDAAAALARVRLPPSDDPGVGVVTGQAGTGLLLVDGLQHRQVRVPPLGGPTSGRIEAALPALTHRQNPVDTGRPGPGFLQAARAVADDPAVDVVVLNALVEPAAVDLATVASEVREASGRPTVVVSGGPRPDLDELRKSLRASDIPLFDTPDRAVTAVWAMIQDARPVRTPPVAVGSPLPALPSRVPSDEATAKDLLDLLGVATPARRHCGDHAEVTAAVDAIGLPVMVKLSHPDVAHKARLGGVHLVRGIADLARALEAIDAIDGLDGRCRYLVERAEAPGLDLIVGVRRDPTWGPVCVIGSGGIDVERHRDVEIVPLPTSPDAVAHAVAPLLRESGPDDTLDERALAHVVNQLGALLDAWPDVDTIEVNPLRVLEQRLIALDALVTTTTTGRDGRDHH